MAGVKIEEKGLEKIVEEKVSRYIPKECLPKFKSQLGASLTAAGASGAVSILYILHNMSQIYGIAKPFLLAKIPLDLALFAYDYHKSRPPKVIYGYGFGQWKDMYRNYAKAHLGATIADGMLLASILLVKMPYTFVLAVPVISTLIYVGLLLRARKENEKYLGEMVQSIKEHIREFERLLDLAKRKVDKEIEKLIKGTQEL